MTPPAGLLEKDLLEKGRRDLFGVPEGYDAWVLAGLAEAAGPRGLLHVAEDARRLERLSRNLRTVAPHIEILRFPAWDTLPYDRASPSARVSALRLEAMAHLAEPAAGPRILVTSAGGLLRRLTPWETLSGAAFRLSAGDAVDREALHGWLYHNGYVPAAEAREPGDMVWSDDGVSLVAPGLDGTLTLDFPGGNLSRIGLDGRELPRAALLPLSEVVLTEATMGRFRNAYLGGDAEAERDPIYQAVAAGRRLAGIEHWLPFFAGETDTLFDRMPDALVTMDEEAVTTRDSRLEQARLAFEARRRQVAVSSKAGLPVHRPAPVEDVFLDVDDWEEGLEGRAVITLRPGEGTGEGALDAGGRRLNLAGEDEEERIASARGQGRRLFVAVDEPAQRRGMVRHLRQEGVAADMADSVAVDGAAPGIGIAVIVLDIDAGFTGPDGSGFAVVTPPELLGEQSSRQRRRRSRRLVDDLAAEAAELAPGSTVVHLEHGIGLSEGLERIDATGVPHDCLRIVYRDDAKSFVPVENLDMLWPFGATDGAVPLDRLGSAVWTQRRDRVADSLRVAAETLVRTQAERALARVEPIRPERRAFRSFVSRFPHEETPDQQAAIDAVLDDIASGQPMDRLICADVGFGKTEIALRAAFAVAMAGRQVAVVAPTTPLSRQHAADFRERFAGFPVRVEELSRSVSPADARAVKAGLKSGEIRIVVGTHALLSASVEFDDLGLLIVDEEQRLGVKQKERLRAISADTHVLTMTATPIPRTLQLATAGLRDLSIIATPPLRRRPVRTEFLEFDPIRVAEALRAERARGGQCFYVCPRVEDLAEVRARLEALVPDFRIIEAHGKMKAEAMEDAMSAFSEGAGDLLLATNIIETGLNIPNANTLVVHRTDRFGLAQLHQLRGRVGRAAVQGRCWLTVEPDQELSEASRQRLEVLTRLDQPGAGFELSARDLGLRGAGDLLGEEQSGHMREVGAELFQELLRQAVEAARAGRPMPAMVHTRVNLGQAVMIPESFIRDANLRLAVYRHLATLNDAEERANFAAALGDRFGPLPPEMEGFLDLGTLKCLSREAGLATLDIGPNGALFAFLEDGGPDGALLERLAAKRPDVKLRPDGRLVLVAGDRPPEAFRSAIRRLLRDLVRLKKEPAGAGQTPSKPQAESAASM
ncbi:DEAD/DEAH box helicase [Azospirillum sp. SYSU D00513]|uniref:transcription-repair coupling factor n=1 Tax=Azospirillum sp. SYSU D00513 TaxID=2812561 RepID=UPI001A96C942|nr:DEAD/DEAH box helicase [Azospirillum sp. SYSU D00513]